MKHRETHAEDVPGCFGCKLLGVQLAGDVTNQRRHDAVFSADQDAYAALRKQGYQPPQVAGAAAIVRNARTKDEIEVGRPLPGNGHLRPDLVPLAQPQ